MKFRSKRSLPFGLEFQIFSMFFKNFIFKNFRAELTRCEGVFGLAEKSAKMGLDCRGSR